MVAVAVLIAIAYSALVLAELPIATPRIITDQNASLSDNVTKAFNTEQLFGYANFSQSNATFEENSTFKWYKRTLYQPQNRSLISYWKMDGNANDSSKFKNDGTVSGATPNQSEDCIADECLFFDGGDYISIATTEYDVAGTTFEFWAKRLTVTAGGSSIRDVIFGRSGTCCQNFIAFREADDGLQLETDTNADSCTVTTGFPTADNNWHHYAISIAAQTCTFYYDGTEVTALDTIVTDNITLNQIGVGYPGFKHFNGSLDEVAIYNYAKDAGEIWNDYYNSTYRAMIYKDAVGYWHLDGNANDASGQGNDGSITGATSVDGGIIRGAYDFDGVNDHINLGQPDSLNFS
ncbi:MAG: LamG domain-containing protein, partial [Anaerolineales bacterium]|nr:LamG domain-containing protein [Anaerolineales bacterium]